MLFACYYEISENHLFKLRKSEDAHENGKQGKHVLSGVKNMLKSVMLCVLSSSTRHQGSFIFFSVIAHVSMFPSTAKCDVFLESSL